MDRMIHQCVRYSEVPLYMYMCVFFIAETATVTATGIANNKTAIERASGWKIYRMDPQIGEMVGHT